MNLSPFPRSKNNKNQQAFIVLAVCLLTDILVVGFYSFHLVYSFIPNHLLRFFNPDAELSIPNWFSSMKLGLVGAGLLCFSFSGSIFTQRTGAFAFGFVALFLSLDEAVGIHDHIGIMLAQITWIPRFKANHGVWIAPYLIAVVIFMAIFYQSVHRLYKIHPKPVIFVLLGFLTLIAGAAGVEVVGYLWYRNTTDTLGYLTWTMAEELLELFGSSLMLYGALLLMSSSNDSGV